MVSREKIQVFFFKGVALGRTYECMGSTDLTQWFIGGYKRRGHGLGTVG